MDELSGLAQIDLHVLVDDPQRKTAGIGARARLIQAASVANTEPPVVNPAGNFISFDDSVSQRGPGVGTAIVQRKKLALHMKDTHQLLPHHVHPCRAFGHVVNLANRLKVGHRLHSN